MTNLASILAESAAAHPEAVAIKLDDVEVSYAALNDLSARVAGLLRGRGVRARDRVALVSPNLPQMPAVYYGILRAGGVVVPLNPLLKAREVAYHLSNAGARLVFAWEGVAGEVEAGAAEAGAEVIRIDGGFQELLAGADPLFEVAAAEPNDTAVILYTSGTTGRPKGAELTHENLLANATVSRDLFDFGVGEVLFGGLPFFHIFGQTCALNAAILAGATVTLLPRFDPVRALEIIERDRVGIFLGVPTMYIALLRVPDRHKYDTSSLRLAASGGAALPLEVLREFESTFDATMLEGYGLSETSPVVCFNQRDGIRKPGSIGTAVRGAELKVVDETGQEVEPGNVGELAVRGGYVMKGYWNNPEATAAAIPDGWFRTGDLARMDDDKVFFIVDRKKDMILRGGYNVYPREVEEVLYEHPAVAEAAVVGRPDELNGEEIVAVVALKPEAAGGDKDALAGEIQQFVKDRIAAYKYPRSVLIVDALPKGPTGKILKREITVPGA
ncbi:long-chain fatty acid--CoA ligase [Paenarthrobacter sp. DKR-5]|uniref:long-chain-fatty-acid--CoA ligase n=1 Tax=Paenarthrobacter sp. DKR-5 TaxID=2835535 RepID=UPI001BDBE642|nr:long-chain fatty acid--CoA ligase [Paenarthrobacter sp. DKR-5]MBT1002759.1 long-chain fatty acid--CoA ligase [Paenarthrobacter sp. DKR-5]